jgi:hypothetical protein
MLKISLDEAYVFDLLSIYQVKIDKSHGHKRDALKKSEKIITDEIISQIGNDLYNEIILSKEYDELKQSNRNVFDLVDRANETELSKLTADANYDRYEKKMMLQSKFFQEKLNEVKI